MVPAGTWDTRNERLLRDHLRAHPEDARRYGDLKRRLAAEHTGGATYTKAKTELIQDLTDRARAARGLPSVPSGKSERATRSASYPNHPRAKRSWRKWLTRRIRYPRIA